MPPPFFSFFFSDFLSEEPKRSSVSVSMNGSGFADLLREKVTLYLGNQPIVLL